MSVVGDIGNELDGSGLGRQSDDDNVPEAFELRQK